MTVLLSNFWADFSFTVNSLKKTTSRFFDWQASES